MSEQAAPRLPEVQVQRVAQAAEAFTLLDALTASDRVFTVVGETLRALCLLDGDTASVLFADDFAENEWDDLLRRLFDGSVELVLHDAKPVVAALLARGIQPDGVRFDTCLAAYLLDPTQSGYDLPRVALAYCNTELPALDLDDPAAVSPLGGQDATAAACAQHAAAIRAIYAEAAEQIEQLGMRKLYYEIELPLVRVLAEMEVLGCAVEPDALRALGDKLDARSLRFIATRTASSTSTAPSSWARCCSTSCTFPRRKRPRPAIRRARMCLSGWLRITRSLAVFWSTAS